VIDSLTISRNTSICLFIYRSYLNRPIFNNLIPNKKLLKVRYWLPTLAIRRYKKTDNYKFSKESSNLSPKNDLTTVLPAIIELNSIELISIGSFYFEFSSNFLNWVYTIETILGMKL